MRDHHDHYASPQKHIHGSTVGFNMEKIGALKVTDVGGSVDSLWKNYFFHKKGIIFVFDSYNTSQHRASKNALHSKILNQKALKGLPLLIYSNKSDLSNLRDKQQVIKLLDLEKIKGRPYHIECVSVTNCNDADQSTFHQSNQDTLHILDGYQWITEQIVKTPLSDLSPRRASATRKWTGIPSMTRSQSLISPRSNRSSITDLSPARSNRSSVTDSTPNEHHGIFHDFHLNFSLRSTKSIPESNQSNSSSTPSPGAVTPITAADRNTRKSSSLGSLMDFAQAFKHASAHPIDTVRLKTHSNSINPFHLGDRKKKMCPKRTLTPSPRKRKGLSIQQSASSDALFHSMPTPIIHNSSMSTLHLRTPGFDAVDSMNDRTVFLFIFGLSSSGKTTMVNRVKYGHFYHVDRSQEQSQYDTVQFTEYKGIRSNINQYGTISDKLRIVEHSEFLFTVSVLLMIIR